MTVNMQNAAANAVTAPPAEANPAPMTPEEQEKAKKKAERKAAREKTLAEHKAAIDAHRAGCEVDAEGKLTDAGRDVFLGKCVEDKTKFVEKAFADYREFALYRAKGYQKLADEWVARSKAPKSGSAKAALKRVEKLTAKLAGLKSELAAMGIDISSVTGEG